MYKAVIFDLDGTLLDTIEDISDSVNATLKRLNHNQHTIDEYKYFVGRGVDELISAVIEKGKLNPDEFFAIKAGYLEEYAKRKSAKTKPYKGILDLLKTLMIMNVDICVLSNKPHFQTVEVIDKYFQEIVFRLVFGKKPEFEIKPNPESAIHMLKILDLNRSEILYVGDTNTDMETAINAGFDKVGVLWGFRTKEELIEAGADFIVVHPNDIISILEGDANDFRTE